MKISPIPNARKIPLHDMSCLYNYDVYGNEVILYHFPLNMTRDKLIKKMKLWPTILIP